MSVVCVSTPPAADRPAVPLQNLLDLTSKLLADDTLWSQKPVHSFNQMRQTVKNVATRPDRDLKSSKTNVKQVNM